MGVQDIVAVIEREAGEEATSIIQDATRRAAEIVAQAEAGVQAQVDAAVERLGPDIRAASRRRVNAVRLRILEERARGEAARLAAVFDAADGQAMAIAAGSDAPRWAAALSALCGEALHAVGVGGSVALRAPDAEAVRRVAERWRAEVVTLADDAEPGLVATSKDGRIEVDVRLSVRLERARSLLVEGVAQRLRLGSVELQEGPTV